MYINVRFFPCGNRFTDLLSVDYFRKVYPVRTQNIIYARPSGHYSNARGDRRCIYNNNIMDVFNYGHTFNFYITPITPKYCIVGIYACTYMSTRGRTHVRKRTRESVKCSSAGRRFGLTVNLAGGRPSSSSSA
jgi:hypothetical protein